MENAPIVRVAGLIGAMFHVKRMGWPTSCQRPRPERLRRLSESAVERGSSSARTALPTDGIGESVRAEDLGQPVLGQCSGDGASARISAAIGSAAAWSDQPRRTPTTRCVASAQWLDRWVAGQPSPTRRPRCALAIEVAARCMTAEPHAYREAPRVIRHDGWHRRRRVRGTGRHARTPDASMDGPAPPVLQRRRRRQLRLALCRRIDCLRGPTGDGVALVMHLRRPVDDHVSRRASPGDHRAQPAVREWHLDECLADGREAVATYSAVSASTIARLTAVARQCGTVTVLRRGCFT